MGLQSGFERLLLILADARSCAERERERERDKDSESERERPEAAILRVSLSPSSDVYLWASLVRKASLLSRSLWTTTPPRILSKRSSLKKKKRGTQVLLWERSVPQQEGLVRSAVHGGSGTRHSQRPFGSFDSRVSLYTRIISGSRAFIVSPILGNDPEPRENASRPRDYTSRSSRDRP